MGQEYDVPAGGPGRGLGRTGVARRDVANADFKEDNPELRTQPFAR